MLKITGISNHLRDLLFVDYQYLRITLNNLSVQAVVERAISQNDNAVNHSMKLSHSSRTIKLSEELLLTSLSTSDHNLTSEVVDACVLTLKKTIHLAHNDHLRFAPVRVYLRIVSASIFLLKAISLGARNADLQASLAVLDECIQALKGASAVDEMHLSSRYGALIERHVNRFRHNFVRPFRDRESSTRRPSVILGLNFRTEMPGQNAMGDHGLEKVLDGFEGEHSGIDLDAMSFSPGNEDIGLGEASGMMSGMGGEEWDDWMAQPFDPRIAPFGMGGAQFTGGLELGSLDFLWNMPS